MPRIKQLAPHEAHKIAAGEVVERPANVVKELLENALDAGTTHITVYLEQAGKQLIRVVDNGCGMDEQDAQHCFDHHATSKITSVEDLDTIGTFGFRGEALSSIAAISTVTLLTREEQTETGTRIERSGSNSPTCSPTSCNVGTDISVRDLFFNMPARKKFLRANDTEWRHISQLFQATCLSNQRVTFKLVHNGKQLFHCPATENIVTRVQQLWEPALAQHMLALQSESPELTGAISDHQQFRYNRNQIFLFINNRWIRDYRLANALIKGYSSVLPHGRYPAACLFITVSPELVDVNIHPRKEEVRLLHPKKITASIQEAVKKTLEQNLSAHLKQDVVLAPTQSPAPVRPTHFAFEPPPRSWQRPAPPAAPLPTTQLDALPFASPPCEIQETTQQKAEPTPHRVIGCLHNTYILLEHPNGLFVVDQHAAHERILYERFAARVAQTVCVQLLFPETVELTREDVATLEPYLPLLREQGVEVEQVGEAQLIVTATPVQIKQIAFGQFIRYVVALIQEHGNLEHTELHTLLTTKVRAQMACKAAVKAGDQLTAEQITQLLIDLEQTENRLTCPHGRPTGWLLATNDLEKKFKRRDW